MTFPWRSTPPTLYLAVDAETRAAFGGKLSAAVLRRTPTLGEQPLTDSQRPYGDVHCYDGDVR